MVILRWDLIYSWAPCFLVKNRGSRKDSQNMESHAWTLSPQTWHRQMKTRPDSLEIIVKCFVSQSLPVFNGNTMMPRLRSPCEARMYINQAVCFKLTICGHGVNMMFFWYKETTCVCNEFVSVFEYFICPWPWNYTTEILTNLWRMYTSHDIRNPLATCLHQKCMQMIHPLSSQIWW